MANRQDGREVVYVGAGTSAVLRGEDDISLWDDEELAWGRRRDTNGRLNGVRPKLIPAECVRELNRRKLFETNGIIRDACTDAATYLADVTRGDQSPNNGRLRAAETILDRFLGKPVDRVQMDAQVTHREEPLWMRVMRAATVNAETGNPIAAEVGLSVQTGEYVGIDAALAEVDSRRIEPRDDIIDAEVVEPESGLSPQCQRAAHDFCRDCECGCHVFAFTAAEPDDEILWDEDDPDPILSEDE